MNTSPSRLGNGQGQQKISGWSEHLLPFLFAGIETCCIDAILVGLADTGILGTNKPLLPLWMPFVLISIFYIISHYLFSKIVSLPAHIISQNERKALADVLLFALISIVTIIVTWVSIYAPQTPQWNPAWLLGILNTVLLFNSNTFLLVGVIVLSIALCKHGEFLARNKIGPSQVFVVMRFGVIVVIVLLVLQKILALIGKAPNDGLIVTVLVSLFFCLAFIAHALARIVSVRRRHRRELARDVSQQERITLQMAVVMSGLLLFVAFMIGNIVPFLAFRSTGNSSHKVSSKQFPIPPSPTCKHTCNPSIPQNPLVQSVGYAIHTLPPVIAAIFGVLLFVLLALTVVILAIAVLYYVRKQRNRQVKDIHESIWAWSLFWDQLRSFLSVLLSRFLPHRAVQQEDLHISEKSAFTHTICRIYRSLLKRTAACGYPRSHFETPYEFASRLVRYMPSIKPELSILTAAYVKARYGNIVLEQTTHVQDTWAKLEQKLVHVKQPFPKGVTHGAEASQHRAFTGAGRT